LALQARARRVALALKDASSCRPRRSTATVAAPRSRSPQRDGAGGALNRRVEVELCTTIRPGAADEPQLCPAMGEEMTTKVYESPGGTLAELALQDGQPIIPPVTQPTWRRARDRHRRSDQPAPAVHRLTKNERLDRRTAEGTATTSASPRHGRAAPWTSFLQDPQLSGARAEHEGPRLRPVRRRRQCRLRSGRKDRSARAGRVTTNWCRSTLTMAWTSRG